MNAQTSEYVAWMAGVWKKNDERNKASQILPDGTPFATYCEDLRRRGRTPLSYDATVELFYLCDEE